MIHIQPNFLGNINKLEHFLERVDHAFRNVPKEDAKIGTKDTVDETRVSKVQFHPGDDFIINTVYDYVKGVNYTTWNFDLHPQFVEMQLAEYNAQDGGHFDWHIDQALQGNDLHQRKLSCTIQLTNFYAYEGGKFELEDPKFVLPETAYEKGSLLLFPSLVRHRVTPVTEGTRWALVMWFHGPRWR